MLQMEVTRRSYAIEIPKIDFDHLMKSDSWKWNGTTLDEESFKHLPGVDTIEFNGHFGPFVYLNIVAEDDTSELREEILSIVSSAIESIKQERRVIVKDMVDMLVDALGTKDWEAVRTSVMHKALAEFREHDASEFMKLLVYYAGFSPDDTVLECNFLTQLRKKFRL